MFFTDYVFVPAFLLFTCVYYMVPRAKRWFLLLIASTLFYCTWGVELLPFVLYATAVAWIETCLMEDAYSRHNEAMQHLDEKNTRKRLALIKMQNQANVAWGVGLLLLPLVYLRLQYVLAEIPVLCEIVGGISWVIRQLRSIPGLSFLIHPVDTERFFFLKPLGIGFFTLSLIGYMADVYSQKEKAERNYLRLLGFVLYFPKMPVGPVVSHRTVGAEIDAGGFFSYRNFCFGWQRILLGFFKKLVIADRLAVFVRSVFSDGAASGAMLLAAAFLSAAQVYCDFSGCVDVAMGASQALGIPLEENFRQPFLAVSAADFWQRWNVSLSCWFREYVYDPLSRSYAMQLIYEDELEKHGEVSARYLAAAIPLGICWVLMGSWYGFGGGSFLWMLFWLVILLLGIPAEPAEYSLLARSLRRCGVFALFAVSRLLILSGSAGGVYRVLGRILLQFRPGSLLDGTLFACGLVPAELMLVLGALALLYVIGLFRERGVHFRERIAAQPAFLRWLFWIVAIFAVLIFGAYSAAVTAPAMPMFC